MITTQDVSRIIGTNAVDSDGSKLGKIGQVYLDDETGRPEWATVRTGLFGTKEAFVPLAQADVAGGEIRVPFDKDKVKHAPHIDADGHLSPAEEEELYRYYGVGTGTGTAGYTETDTTRTADTTQTPLEECS